MNAYRVSPLAVKLNLWYLQPIIAAAGFIHNMGIPKMYFSCTIVNIHSGQAPEMGCRWCSTHCVRFPSQIRHFKACCFFGNPFFPRQRFEGALFAGVPAANQHARSPPRAFVLVSLLLLLLIQRARWPG